MPRSSSASSICAGLWATYFLRYAERGAEAISSTVADAASVGRTGYAYAHAMMVAGVILVAVAIHLTIDNPDESAVGRVGADDARRAGAVPRRPGPVQVGRRRPIWCARL